MAVLDPDHAPLQVGDPVVLRLTGQDVGRGEDDLVAGKLGLQGREETHVPEFPDLAPIARGAVAEEVPVGDQFPQPDVAALRPRCS